MTRSATGSTTGSTSLRSLAALLGDPRAVAVALTAAAAFLLVVAVPTDLVDTPLFTRQIPPTRWAWPALVASSVLGGLVAATYVRPGAGSGEHASPQQGAGDRSVVEDRASRSGSTVAGLLTFFAVGCPVCNKLVLLALGATGAVTWFAPVQPLLQVAALGLMAWALTRRLRTQSSCPLPPSTPAPTR